MYTNLMCCPVIIVTVHGICVWGGGMRYVCAYYVHVCLCVRLCVCVRVCVRARARACVCVCVFVYVNVCRVIFDKCCILNTSVENCRQIFV